MRQDMLLRSINAGVWALVLLHGGIDASEQPDPLGTRWMHDLMECVLDEAKRARPDLE